MNAIKIAYKSYDYVLLNAYETEHLPTAAGSGELLRISDGSLEMVTVRDSSMPFKINVYCEGITIEYVADMYEKMFPIDSAIKRISSALIRVSPGKMMGPAQIGSYIEAAWGCESECCHSTLCVESICTQFEIEMDDVDGKQIRVLVIYADAEPN